jgi:hypothetical protein
MAPAGVTDGVPPSQDKEAMVMEMTMLMQQAQDSLQNMQRLWSAILPTVQVQTQQSAKQDATEPWGSVVPEVAEVPRPWGMMRKAHAAQDQGFAQGCDLDKTCSGRSAGTPATVRAGNFMDHKARLQVDVFGSPQSANDGNMWAPVQEPPGLMKTQSLNQVLHVVFYYVGWDCVGKTVTLLEQQHIV